MVKTEKIRIPAANLGDKKPLPDIKNNTYIHASIDITRRVSEDEAKYIGKGMIPTLLPYLTEDGYDRDKKEREIDIIVLENEYLRAEFFPSLGARLRRLYDKEGKRELLYVNPVFQPCNLALRNAWFSGGAEFNVGIKGHNPLTCSPMFAERRVDENGEEYVSFYEYERIRGVVYSVNAYLPEGARTLKLRICIENTSDEEKYMYWWSNIAVEEIPGMRVLVPTHETFINYFGDDAYVLDKGSVPYELGTDISYPEKLTRSIDFFYKIPEQKRKWIASVGPDGCGFLHYSDDILKGRKTFLWGQSKGGRHFAEFLSVPGSSYIEIQGGLANTQLEHFPMAAGSKIEWVEAYAPLDCEPSEIFGEYDAAVSAVERELDKKLSESGLSAPPLAPAERLQLCEMVYRGSAFGALENSIRNYPISDYFDDWESYDRSADDYIQLLQKGVLPQASVFEAPKSYVTGRFWENKIRESLTKAEGEHFYSYLILGVVLYELGCKGDERAMAECVKMWERSLELRENPWAYRNIAAYLASEAGDKTVAADYIVRALEMKPDERALAISCGQILLSAGQNERWLQICGLLSDALKKNGRIALLRARAELALDMLEEAEKTINENFEMPDIKEGELSISTLWFTLQAKKNRISEEEAKARFELPYSLDFRMH